jgi:hypothetical protein
MSDGLSLRRLGFRAGGLVAAFLLLSGCGESRKPVFPVQGQLFDADGKPAAGAKLIFHPQDDTDPNAARPVGVVDPSGAFSLTTYEKGDGAPAGNYAVTIEWRPARTAPFSPIPEDQLKGRFANATKSPYKATVGKQPTTLEPFRLN